MLEKIFNKFPNRITIAKKYLTIKDGVVTFRNKNYTVENLFDDEIDGLPIHTVVSTYGPNWNYVPLYDLVLANDKFEIVWIPDCVSLSGSLVYGSDSPNDIDLILRTSEIQADQSINIKVQRLRFDIPDAAFNLVLRKHDKPVIHEINENVSSLLIKALRTKNEEILREAQESKKEDKIVPLRAFLPGKPEFSPINAYRKGEIFSMDQLKTELSNYAEKHGWDYIIQAKVDGARNILHKKGDKIKIISDDGSDTSGKFTDLVERVSKIDHDIVLDIEVEAFRGNKHLNREEMAGILHSKETPSDVHFVYNIFDILYYDEDLHKKPYIERLEYLDKLDIFDGSETKHRYKLSINKLEYWRVKSWKETQDIIQKLLDIQDIEGAMIKPSDSIYPLNGNVPWFKYKRYAEVHVAVLDAQKTKDGRAFVYDIGVIYDESIEVPDKELVEIGDTVYIRVGKTYNTDIEAKKGDVLSVACHNINVYEDRVNLYEPIVMEKFPESESVDSLSTLIQIGKEADILSIKKQDFWLPLWVPESKEYNYMIHRHFRGKSVTDRTPVYVRKNGRIDIVPIYTLFSGNDKASFTEIKDIEIWTSQGWKKILKAIRHPLGFDKIYTLKMQSGYLEVTGSHSVFVNGKAIETNQISTLSEIDKMDFPPQEDQLMVDEDLIRLLAQVIKEGELNDKLIQLPKEDFDLADRIRKKYGLFLIETDDSILISGISLIHSVFSGKTVVYRRIPFYVFQWHPDCIKLLLDLLFNKKKKKFEVDNFQIAEQIIYLNYLANHSYLNVSIVRDKVYLKPAETRDSKVFEKGNLELVDGDHNFTSYPKTRFVYDIETETGDFAGGLGCLRLHNSSHLDWRAKIV